MKNYSAKKRNIIVSGLSKRDGCKCFYCGLKMSYPTIEHIRNLSDGGSWDDENLALAHMACNSYVGNLNKRLKFKLKRILDSSEGARKNFLKRVAQRHEAMRMNSVAINADFQRMHADFHGEIK